MYVIEALDHVAIYVRDLPQSVAWYESILGMKIRGQDQDSIGSGNPVVMSAGSAAVTLFPSMPESPASTYEFHGHIAMRLTRPNLEQAQLHLEQCGIEITRVQYATGIAIYFNDPDGYLIEFNTYELDD